jgi:DNA (cytosine-5)-methyltransferase 1
MRYLSVCSGIEAASVAWHHLGWEPVGFSEIEPFPAAVLAHRFLNIPNYGDMTQHEQWPIRPGSIDLLVGGTPCQSYSVAGLRQGLADPRGNLMLTYLAIAARLKPRWLVWENVPGVLSSNGGRDFGTFLGALGELGYGWAYRVLDAQYLRVGGWPRAVPQRRRRVFVVGRLIERSARDWAAPGEVLAIAEGLQRNLEARRAKGKGVAADAEGGVARCITTGEMKRQDYETCTMIAQPTAYRWQNDRDGLQQDDAVAALRASQGASGFHEMNHPVIAQPVPYDLFQITAPVNRQNRVPGDPCHTLAKDNAAHAAVAFDWQKGNDIHNPRPSTMNVQHECTPTIGTTRTPAVAHAFYSTGGTHGVNQHPEVSPAVKVGSGLGIPSPPAVAFTDTSATIKGGSGARGYPDPSDGNGHSIVGNAMTVRRLTPRECERLQGFPDDWTRIPYRGKPPEECPDGPRYKALGNSMACNCMSWIGERIAAYENHNP